MSQNTLKSMSHPLITARGSEYREIMAELKWAIEVAFNLSELV